MLRIPVLPLLALSSLLVACSSSSVESLLGPQGAGTDTHHEALNEGSLGGSTIVPNIAPDMAIAPVTQLNNRHHADPSGFTVWWRTVQGGLNMRPTISVSPTPGSIVCGSHTGATQCDYTATNPYCRCMVTGVQRATTYQITVNYNGHSYYASVKTRPADGADTFSFDFFSDAHNNANNHLRWTARAINGDHNAGNADFAIDGGDVGEYGDGYSTTGTGYNSLTAPELSFHFENKDGMRTRVPTFEVVGNHDWWGNSWGVENGSGWPRLLCLSGGDPGCYRPTEPTGTSDVGWEYRYYSFDYGNTRFFVLDTGLHSRFDVGGAWEAHFHDHDALDIDSAQLKWLQNELIDAEATSYIKNKIVIMHSPMYDSSGDQAELIESNIDGYTDDQGDTQWGLGPAIEKWLRKYGVTLVLSGHRHHYENLTRFGITYVICSGAASYDESISLPSASHATLQAWSTTGGYCNIYVNGNQITLQRKKTADITNGTESMYDPAVVVDTNYIGGYPRPSSLTTSVAANSGANRKIAVTFNTHTVLQPTTEIWRSTNNVNFSLVASIAHTLGGNTRWDDTNVLPGYTYYYKVRASFSGGYSDFSDTSATTFPDCALQNFGAFYQPGQVLLGWSDFNITCPGVGVDHYEVERYDSVRQRWQVVLSTTYTLGADNYLSQQIYAYRARAVAPNGHYSDYGTPVFGVNALAEAPRPGPLTVRPLSANLIRLDWDNDTLNSLAVEHSIDGTHWEDLYLSDSVTTKNYIAAVGSSCGIHAINDYFRVGAYLGTGPRTYNAVVIGHPAPCLATPALTPSLLGNAVKLALSFPNPVGGAPVPDSWVLEWRVPGQTHFGHQRVFSYPGVTTATITDLDCTQTYEFRTTGFYSGARGASPHGIATPDSSIVQVTPSCGPCASGAADQIFSPGMLGCGGAVSWSQRNSLCAPGYTACTAAEWRDNRGGVAPTKNYWTDDNLGYSGSGAGACSANTSGVTSCGGSSPMRVCSGTSDSYGNACNWTGCGMDGNSPNQYFGGCVGNTTAGTLCCKRRDVCSDLATAVQPFAPGVAGCAGIVGWDGRNALCGKHCRACSAAEYQAARKSAVPSYNYWTDDNLQYTGSGPNACGAVPSGGYSCGTNQPMHVCIPGGGTDQLGNTCNWGSCGLNGNTPATANDYFGGCAGNTTAGTVCCCDR